MKIKRVLVGAAVVDATREMWAFFGDHPLREADRRTPAGHR